MVSGWDKSPGPDNDYASATPTKRLSLRFIALVAIAGAVAILIMI
jgi:hypothetical protein